MRTRYELTVHLVTRSPLHSGGVDVPVDRSRSGSDREAEPRCFARDGHGNPIITGRSVKGALRAACEHLTDDEIGDLGPLWGDQDRAAALTFHAIELDKTAVSTDPAGTEGEEGRSPLATRTGIAVDRYWGTAGNTALFAHEYVPAGKGLELTITAQAGTPDGLPPVGGGAPQQAATPEQVERLFALILGLFKAGRVGFGGRRNAGWGRVELDGDKAWRLTRAELGSREGLMTWLSGGQDITGRIGPVDCGNTERARISIGWDSPSGILVAEPREKKADEPAEETDREPADGEPSSEETEPTRPLRCGPGENDLLVLPGSSVRGALRSRASRIARTVLAARDMLGDQRDWSGTGVHAQLANDPVLVRDLFGGTDHRGALTVLDTLAAGPGSWRRITHNAGDRWTGGAAEGALYSEEVHDVGWNSIELELDPGMLPEEADLNRRRAAWCLLGLTLAELAAGTLPLGSRGTRGLGQVRVTRISVEGGPGIVGEPWDLHDEGSEPLPEQILARLRQVQIEPNPAAGDDGWTGWSSYLVEGEDA
ncbi:RAMP superfamily CRISPR-associated protein [Propionibacterium australiense]|uniref:CRISPR-associated protein n=1 Tax=Propionibacterium australiense TaxID=119981 RepID=A0A8B3GE79_9ACTN|nr:RAMP superfamily CRISPR-associated protein [Propionibacterium australiense]RLP08359.1 CRISPR-associated protein [Propionibacterium australiense]